MAAGGRRVGAAVLLAGCVCMAVDTTPWTCPAGFIFAPADVAVSLFPAVTVGACMPCNSPGFYCPQPACNRSTPFTYYWAIDNTTSMDLRAYPAIVKGHATNMYGNTGYMPQKTSTGAIINGGIPQLGNLTLHTAAMLRDIGKTTVIPNSNFSGICCLDYEFWRGDWNSTQLYYRNASFALVAGRHPELNASAVLELATAEYQDAAHVFLGASLALAQAQRPLCKWGVYGYPSNDFSEGGYLGKNGPKMVYTNTNVLRWMWDASDILTPSIYLTSPNRSTWDGQTTDTYIRTTVVEARRVARLSSRTVPVQVYPLVWYVYNTYPRPVNWAYLNAGDLDISLRLPAALGADGVMLWGAVSSSQPFTTSGLHAYLHSTFGPAIQRAHDVACNNATLATAPVPQACVLGNGTLANGDARYISLTPGDCVNATASGGGEGTSSASVVWACPVVCAAGYQSASSLAGVYSGSAVCDVQLGIVAVKLTCDTCPADTISSVNSTCVSCPPGHSATSNHTVCVLASPSPVPTVTQSPTASASCTCTSSFSTAPTTTPTASASYTCTGSVSTAPTTTPSVSPATTGTNSLSVSTTPSIVAASLTLATSASTPSGMPSSSLQESTHATPSLSPQPLTPSPTVTMGGALGSAPTTATRTPSTSVDAQTASGLDDHSSRESSGGLSTGVAVAVGCGVALVLSIGVALASRRVQRKRRIRRATAAIRVQSTDTDGVDPNSCISSAVEAAGRSDIGVVQPQGCTIIVSPLEPLRNQPSSRHSRFGNKVVFDTRPIFSAT